MTERFSRRQFASLLGTAGASTLLAGSSIAAEPTTDGQSTNVTFTNVTTYQPTNVQFNPYNSSGIDEQIHDLVYDRLARFDIASGEFIMSAVSDWSFEGTNVELTLRDGLQWHDGTDVTARDLATKLLLDRKNGMGLGVPIDSVSVSGDGTVEVTLAEPTNPRIVKHELADRRIDTPHHVYKQFLDSSDEDLRSFSLSGSDVVGSGPFRFEEVTESDMLLSRFSAHPDASDINFDRYRFVYKTGNNAILQAFIDGEIDSGSGVSAPSRVDSSLPDSVVEAQIPDKWGYGLIPDHDHEHVGDRAVRQAIMHVLDRETIVEDAGFPKRSPEIPTGITTDGQKRWLGDAKEAFDTYGVGESRTERATELLEAAGYSKVDGTWTDETGTPVALPITIPDGWSDWVLVTEAIVKQLSEFGFEASLEGSGSIFETYSSGDFVLAAGSWLPSGVGTSFPHASLTHQLVDSSYDYAYNYPAANESHGGSGDSVTVPSRTGSGEMTVTPTDRLDELAHATDASTTEAIIREQAWVANQDLPMLPIAEKLNQSFFQTDEWSLPPEGADDYQVEWPSTWLPRQGKLSYAGTEPETPTVSVEFDSEEIRTAESTTAKVVMSSAPQGLAGFDITVSVADPSVATIEDIKPPEAYRLTDASVAEDGSSATLKAVDAQKAVGGGATDVELATVTLSGHSAGETSVDVIPEWVDNDAGERFTPPTDGAALSVSYLPPAVGDHRPRDSDDDGIHEDFNANGRLDSDDVVTFFQHKEDDAVTNNSEAYDVNDNDRVDFDDIASLFKEL